MSWYRWLGCATLLGVVDASWLYLLLGLLGFVAGIGHAPLSWAVVTAILAMGLVSRAVRDLIPGSWRIRAALIPCLALLTGWLAVSSAVGFQAASPGFGWPFEVLAGDVGTSALVVIALVTLIVAGLWQQGGRRARGVPGTPVIARSFRAGLVVFTVLLAFESAGNLDLGTRIAMGPFFIASLLGMALARAPAHGVKLHVWLGLAIAAIVVIVVCALALALLTVAVVRGGFAALRDVWLELMRAVDRSVSEMLVELLGKRTAGNLDPQSVVAEPSQTLMLLVLLLGAMMLAPLMYRLLNTPARLDMPRIVLDFGRAEHEPIAGHDSEVAGQLLESLFAGWPWRRRANLVAWPLPEHAGLARVYALYYGLLDRAQARGVAINPAHTPRERCAALRVALPELPIDRLTSVFEAACYGREVAPQSELDRLSERCGC